MCHTDPTGRRAAVAPSALRAGGARGAAPETNWTGRAVSAAKRTRRMRCSSLIDVFWTGIWIWTESFFNHSSLWFILLFIKFKYVKLTLNRLRNNDAICWVFTNFNDPSIPPPPANSHPLWLILKTTSTPILLIILSYFCSLFVSYFSFFLSNGFILNEQKYLCNNCNCKQQS